MVWRLFGAKPLSKSIKTHFPRVYDKEDLYKLWKTGGGEVGNVDPFHMAEQSLLTYRQTCNISRTLAGNKIVDHSDVTHILDLIQVWLQWIGQR